MSRRDRRHPARLSPIFEEPHFSRELLLDQYPGAEVALSLRKLRYGYSGDCIRVRRSSDDAEQDIGFDGGTLDTTALLNFVEAGDGFVTVWYDQSGNGVNLGNSTLSTQPKIVSGGTIVKSDAVIALDMTNGEHLRGDLVISDPISVFAVADRNGQKFYGRLTSLAPDGANDGTSGYIPLIGDGNNNTNDWSSYDTSNTIAPVSQPGGMNQVTHIIDTSQNITNRVNKGQNESTGISGVDPSNQTLEKIATGTDAGVTSRADTKLNGYVRELIVYEKNMQTDDAAIEQNQLDSY